MKNFSFMSYEKLRKTWMYQVLDILTPHLGDDFKHLKKDLYRICENGFYVYAKKRENQNDDDKRIDVYEHVHDFLHKLILHCPNENFKMTRYYGYYSNKYKPMLDNIYELYGKKKNRKIK